MVVVRALFSIIVLMSLSLHTSANADSLLCTDSFYEDIVHSQDKSERTTQSPISHEVHINENTATIRSSKSWALTEPPLYDLACSGTFDQGLYCTSAEFGRAFRINPQQMNFTYIISQPGSMLPGMGFYQLHTGQCDRK